MLAALLAAALLAVHCWLCTVGCLALKPSPLQIVSAMGTEEGAVAVGNSVEAVVAYLATQTVVAVAAVAVA